MKRAFRIVGLCVLAAGVAYLCFGPPLYRPGPATGGAYEPVRICRCGGVMEVANTIDGEHVYLCQECRHALWPDGTWKPPPERRVPETWKGD